MNLSNWYVLNCYYSFWGNVYKDLPFNILSQAHFPCSCHVCNESITASIWIYGNVICSAVLQPFWKNSNNSCSEVQSLYWTIPSSQHSFFFFLEVFSQLFICILFFCYKNEPDPPQGYFCTKSSWLKSLHNAIGISYPRRCSRYSSLVWDSFCTF